MNREKCTQHSTPAEMKIALLLAIRTALQHTSLKPPSTADLSTQYLPGSLRTTDTHTQCSQSKQASTMTTESMSTSLDSHTAHLALHEKAPDSEATASAYIETHTVADAMHTACKKEKALSDKERALTRIRKRPLHVNMQRAVNGRAKQKRPTAEGKTSAKERYAHTHREKAHFSSGQTERRPQEQPRHMLLLMFEKRT